MQMKHKKTLPRDLWSAQRRILIFPTRRMMSLQLRSRTRARAQGVLLEVLVLMPDFCFDGSCFDLFLFHIKHEDGFFFVRVLVVVTM